MALSEIHNYYEDLVRKYIDALELVTTRSDDYIADLYCLALNQLPVHYIRHGVDMYFYMSDEKRQEMEEKVIYAVTSAISWLDNEEREKNKLKTLEAQHKKAEEEAKRAKEVADEAERKARKAAAIAAELARQSKHAKQALVDTEERQGGMSTD
ncbi:MAG: late competence development ComFB family protein [Succinivibrionaceae bacterium]|nr:late competence development ComFB family protein [Succinivibrionaceae bacterium]